MNHPFSSSAFCLGIKYSIPSIREADGQAFQEALPYVCLSSLPSPCFHIFGNEQLFSMKPSFFSQLLLTPQHLEADRACITAVLTLESSVSPKFGLAAALKAL